ncbi:MAG TPA: EAL domain-containing protein [Egibacteraceae bacterium]|nr:EAL domain-containing protein [Egibacteraceae bacterium]
MVGRLLVGRQLVGGRLVVGRVGLTLAAVQPGPPRSMTRPPASGSARVWALTTVLAAAAGGLHVAAVGPLAPLQVPLRLPVWVLATLFALAEASVFHVSFRRHVHSRSMSEVPLVLGLVFARPDELVLAHLTGSALALLLHRRQPVLKASFNLAVFWLEACTAIVLYRWLLGGGTPVTPRGWSAALAAALLATWALRALAVPLAISVYEGRWQPHIFRWVLVASMVATVTNTSLALLAVTILWFQPAAVWFVAVVAVVMSCAYRGYGSWRQRHDSLERLHELTRIDEPMPTEAMARTLLEQARDLLQAEIAEVVLTAPRGNRPSLSLALGPDDRFREPRGAPLIEVVEGRRAVLARRNPSTPALRAFLHARALKDAMVVPLSGKGGALGTLLVGNRLGDVSTFGVWDLKLFETLANHASMALENSALIDRLRQEAADREHQALHDSLTGLPNRGLFHEQVQAAIAADVTGARVAVMLIDLDRFKDVNDTLGHHTGDRLLQQIGARIRDALRPCDSIARLGGDEFAVLLPAVAGAVAVRVAERIRARLCQPFDVDDMLLQVGGSIGIALAPDHGHSSSILLRCADVAMYHAKLSQSGVELYAPERDQYSPRRLTLVCELQAAIAGSGLAVHYQPQAELRTGRVVGVEALVRWHHPVHGPIAPDEFIPLAEQAGLIRGLTRYVLRCVLQQCQRWRSTGVDLTVAVNLSVRNLLDLELPDEVARLLVEFQVPARMLRLEITESCMMTDPRRTEEVLAKLRGMGVSLAIDDFGTGYSSLSSLGRLPVDEIKIDRSFVTKMLSAASDAVIVRSTIDLARNLGLRVVAEGVEDRATWNRLVTLGCDVAQGYYLSHPVTIARLDDWLRTRASQPVIPTAATWGAGG